MTAKTPGAEACGLVVSQDLFREHHGLELLIAGEGILAVKIHVIHLQLRIAGMCPNQDVKV